MKEFVILPFFSPPILNVLTDSTFSIFQTFEQLFKDFFGFEKLFIPYINVLRYESNSVLKTVTYFDKSYIKSNAIKDGVLNHLGLEQSLAGLQNKKLWY